MDSGNSGSMQSSSGGDEEYDSRGESISNFLNQSGQFDSIISSSSSPQPQFLFHHSQNPDAAFPQSLANLNSQYGNNNNHDLVWPRGLRSEPGFGSFGNLVSPPPPPSSSSPLSSSTTQALLGAHQGMIGDNHHGPFSSSSSLPSVQPTVEMRGSSDVVVSHQPKNPKKRTRASRRAPTTVLTTDTANFRQMVQEFTGIPTAPFSVGSPYSRRLDLFSTAGSAMRSAHLDGLGPLYPLRPSAQKVQSSPFLNNNMLDALMAANNARSGGGNNTPTTVAAAATNGPGSNLSNINLGNTDLGITKQGPNMLNMQNQILPFHPLLQPTIKNPLDNANASMDDALGIINNEQATANLGGFPTQQGINDGGNHQMRSFEGNNGNYKQNCSTSSTSEFHPEKGLENVP